MIGRLSANLTPAFPALSRGTGRVQFTLYTVASNVRTPLDLTGYTAKFTLKSTDGTLLFSAATDGDGISLGGEAGTFALDTSDMNTPPTNVPAGEHSYLLQLRNGSGELELAMLGHWTWDEDISP